MSKLRPRRRLRRLRSMSADQRLLRTRRPPATTPQRLPLRLSSDPFASNFGCHAAWWRAPVSPPAPNRISTVRLVAYRFDSFGSLALFEPVTRRVTFGLRIMGFGRGGSYSFGPSQTQLQASSAAAARVGAPRTIVTAGSVRVWDESMLPLRRLRRR